MSVIVNRDQIRRAAELRKQVLRTSLPRGKGNRYRVPKIYDRNEIAELVLKGLSNSQIAKIVGCSTWPVQVVRKQLKERIGICENP